MGLEPEELITAVYMQKIGIGKIVAYRDDKIWEMEIGDPYVPVEELVSLFGDNSLPLPYELPKIIKTLVIEMRSMGTDISQTVRDKTQNVRVVCPAGCTPLPTNMSSAIMHLNDQHKWTREAIADWLDTLEQQPVFYPSSDQIRTTNSARVVTCKPIVQEGSG